MNKIKISYEKKGEAADIVAAIRNVSRVRRVKYLKDGKYHRIYINADQLPGKYAKKDPEDLVFCQKNDPKNQGNG